jgi:hypothetical protein
MWAASNGHKLGLLDMLPNPCTTVQRLVYVIPFAAYSWTIDSLLCSLLGGLSGLSFNDKKPQRSRSLPTNLPKPIYAVSEPPCDHFCQGLIQGLLQFLCFYWSNCPAVQFICVLLDLCNPISVHTLVICLWALREFN